ncbi:MAG TPA: MBL fold metallo-hydrolase [Bacteroidia bacterium]|nr:MBL fold metallo-hydrolase [Bacteroidia bacterium]
MTNKLKFTFLGTGTSQGIPVIGCKCSICQSTDEKDKRLRCSMLIQSETSTAVIDSGPDFRQQMLRAKVTKLDGLVFTHEHKDHVAGMDDIRAFNFVQKKKINVYASQQVQRALQREFPYIFEEEKYPGVPEIEMKTIAKNNTFSVGDIPFLPIEVFHYKLPVLAFRMKDFTYITDANQIDRNSMDQIRGSKVVVINALRKEKHISHFTLNDAVEILKELDPEKGFLIHMSHQMGLHKEINASLPINIECAFDSLSIEC